MRFLNDIRKYRKYIVYAAKAQLRSEVSNSYFDWLWWILEPFGLMIVYAIVFGTIFGATEKYFTIFIFSGNAMWGFFSKSIVSSVRMIKSNETTISQVYLPKIVLVLVELFVNAYKMSICFGIVLVMLFIYRVPITWRVILLVPIFAVFFILIYGCCLIVMHIGVFIDDLAYVINISLNMLMYISGLFYSFDRFEEPYRMILQTANPFAFLMTSMRQVLLYSQNPDYIWLLVWFGISLIIAAFGTQLVYKNENNYVKVI